MNSKVGGSNGGFLANVINSNFSASDPLFNAEE